MTERRWDTDETGHGIADARAALPAIHELAELAEQTDWVAEDPAGHLLPGLRDRIAISGLSLESAVTDDDGMMAVKLSTATKQSRREIRQSVWSIIGGAAELTTHVHESVVDDAIRFDVVTGIPPGGPFATHGHTLRIEVKETR